MPTNHTGKVEAYYWFYPKKKQDPEKVYQLQLLLAKEGDCGLHYTGDGPADGMWFGKEHQNFEHEVECIDFCKNNGLYDLN